MQVQANSMQYIYAQMQSLMGSLAADVAGISAPSGQDVPGASANSSSSSTTAAATTTAPTAAASTPSSQFSSGMLSSLISLQSQPPSVSDVANKVISSLDTNGDGELSLSEFEQALGGSSSASTASSTAASTATAAATSAADTVLAAGFAKLDTNGDGELSASELTTEIQNALQATQSGADQTGQTEGAQHHHGHHHHMGGANPSSATASTTSTDSTTTAGSTSTSGSSTTTSTAAAILS